jgi:hypothetical protein
MPELLQTTGAGNILNKEIKSENQTFAEKL